MDTSLYVYLLFILFFEHHEFNGQKHISDVTFIILIVLHILV